MAADFVQDRLSASLGMSIDGIKAADATPETKALIPHHADVRLVLSGVRASALIGLLRAATEPDADADALQARATALLAAPNTWVGIEALSFDSGPLAVAGSAKLKPGAMGGIGGEIHLTARGLDAMLARLQGQPNMQQVLPMLFIAKGMARAQGDSLVWDITLGDGPPRINGVPFGQPPARTR